MSWRFLNISVIKGEKVFGNLLLKAQQLICIITWILMPKTINPGWLCEMKKNNNSAFRTNVQFTKEYAIQKHKHPTIDFVIKRGKIQTLIPNCLHMDMQNRQY